MTVLLFANLARHRGSSSSSSSLLFFFGGNGLQYLFRSTLALWAFGEVAGEASKVR